MELPPDILHDIFLHAAVDTSWIFDNDWGRLEGIQLLQPLNVHLSTSLIAFRVAAVSRIWRAVAITTPKLWSSIRTPKLYGVQRWMHTDDALRSWLDLHLDRSAQTPLTIEFETEDCPGHSLYQELLGRILHYAPHIRVFRAIVGDVSGRVIAATLFPILEHCVVIPVGATADWVDWSWPAGFEFVKTLNTSSPALVDLRIADPYCREPMACAPALARLKRLAIHTGQWAGVLDVVAALEQARRVEQLALYTCTESSSVFPGESKIDMPNLRLLRLSGNAGLLFDEGLVLNLPDIQDLHLDTLASWPTTSNFWTMISSDNCTQLTSLHLNKMNLETTESAQMLANLKLVRIIKFRWCVIGLDFVRVFAKDAQAEGNDASWPALEELRLGFSVSFQPKVACQELLEGRCVAAGVDGWTEESLTRTIHAIENAALEDTDDLILHTR